MLRSLAAEPMPSDDDESEPGSSLANDVGWVVFGGEADEPDEHTDPVTSNSFFQAAQHALATVPCDEVHGWCIGPGIPVRLAPNGVVAEPGFQ